MSRLRTALLASAALSVAVTAAPNMAAAQLVDDTIIVTTQKREESILDVPLAISAVTGDFLESSGIQDLDDLSDYVAGFTLQLQTVTTPSFVIRGISSDASEPNSEPNVSVFYDGIPASRGPGAVLELFDVERVEIAKGPQGTLFSRGASNGAVNFILNKPTDENSAEVSVEFGNYGNERYEGIVNSVIAEDAVFLRLGAVYHQRDGFIENAAGGEKLQGKDTLHLRGSLTALPADGLEVTVMAYYQEDNPAPTPVKTLVPLVSALDPNLQGDTDPFGTYSQDPAAFTDREVYGVTGLIEYEVNDAITIASTTGYRAFEGVDFFDPDGVSFRIFDGTEDDEGSVFFQEVRATYDDGGRFRGFAGASYYFEDATRNRIFDISQDNALSILLPILAPGTQLPPISGLPVIAEDVTVNSETESYSFFADGTYDITETVSFTAGVRWTTDDKSIDFRSETTESEVFPGFSFPGSLLPLVFADVGELFVFGAGDFAALGRFVDSLPTNEFSPGNDILLGALASEFGIDFTNPQLLALLSPAQIARLQIIETNVLEGTSGGQTLVNSDSFDYFEPRFILEWEFMPEWLAYASYSWGIRSGGVEIEPRLGTTVDRYGRTVDPEKVTSYEVGAKGSLDLEVAQVTLEGAAFYYDYTDFQTLIIEQGSLQNVNAGEASAKGFELAATANFVGGLDLFGNVSFLDGGFDEGATAGVLGGTFDLSGNEFRLTPKWALSGGASYSAELSEDLKGFASVLVSYKGRHFFNPENETANPVTPVDLAQDAYTTVTLNAGITYDERWELRARAENLFDEEYLIDAGNTGRLLGIPTAVRGQPRLWTVGVSAKF